MAPGTYRVLVPSHTVQEEWIFLESEDGPLRPGFRIADSDLADFSIISNSAGGPAAREYARQLQVILEALTTASMVIERVEVDSREVEDLPLDQRVLGLEFPIAMEDRDDHLALRRVLSAAQRRIGQQPGRRGGNGNRRIRIHVTSNGLSPDEFVSGLLPVGGALRQPDAARARDVIEQILTLTRLEIEQAIEEWKAIGRDEFLARYGANKAFRYLIHIGGVEFDAKAVVVGALKRCRPGLGNFRASVFNGNATTIAQPLRQLGFDIIDLELDAREVEDDRHEQELRNRVLDAPVERHQLVKARRGQGIFRDNVESREPMCRVTGISNSRYLRASHIKPWRASNDVEKIDGNNGLMLAPHVDFLFDQGFISFEDDGTLLVSEQLDEGTLLVWGIPEILNVGAFSADQAEYLSFHRENVFKK